MTRHGSCDCESIAKEQLETIIYGEEVVKALFSYLSGNALTECYRLVAFHGGYSLHASLEAVSSLLRRTALRTDIPDYQNLEYQEDGSVVEEDGKVIQMEELAMEIASIAELWQGDPFDKEPIPHPDVCAIAKWIYEALPQQPFLLCHFKCELAGEKRVLRFVPVDERVDDPILRWQNKK